MIEDRKTLTIEGNRVCRWLSMGWLVITPLLSFYVLNKLPIVNNPLTSAHSFYLWWIALFVLWALFVLAGIYFLAISIPAIKHRKIPFSSSLNPFKSTQKTGASALLISIILVIIGFAMVVCPILYFPIIVNEAINTRVERVKLINLGVIKDGSQDREKR